MLVTYADGRIILQALCGKSLVVSIKQYMQTLV